MKVHLIFSRYLLHDKGEVLVGCQGWNDISVTSPHSLSLRMLTLGEDVSHTGLLDDLQRVAELLHGLDHVLHLLLVFNFNWFSPKWDTDSTLENYMG